MLEEVKGALLRLLREGPCVLDVLQGDEERHLRVVPGVAQRPESAVAERERRADSMLGFEVHGETDGPALLGGLVQATDVLVCVEP